MNENPTVIPIHQCVMCGYVQRKSMTNADKCSECGYVSSVGSRATVRIQHCEGCHCRIRIGRTWCEFCAPIKQM